MLLIACCKLLVSKYRVVVGTNIICIINFNRLRSFIALLCLTAAKYVKKCSLKQNKSTYTQKIRHQLKCNKIYYRKFQYLSRLHSFEPDSEMIMLNTRPHGPQNGSKGLGEVKKYNAY